MESVKNFWNFVQKGQRSTEIPYHSEDCIKGEGQLHTLYERVAKSHWE